MVFGELGIISEPTDYDAIVNNYFRSVIRLAKEDSIGPFLPKGKIKVQKKHDKALLETLTIVKSVQSLVHESRQTNEPNQEAKLGKRSRSMSHQGPLNLMRQQTSAMVSRYSIKSQ